MDNKIVIDSETANQRFDKFLLKYFNKAPKSFVYKMLRKKRIKLNGARAEGSEILSPGDEITLYISPETMDGFMEEKEVKRSAGELLVVYEDKNILICNKQKGLLTHSQSAGDTDTLIDRVVYYLHQKGEYIPTKQSTFAPIAANRLDRNTSGIIVCGKNLQAAQALNLCFKERKIEKYYVAVAKGQIKEKLVLTGFHKKDEKTNTVNITQTGGGKEVVTEIEPIKTTADYTVVRVHLITGRTHQIRAHLQSIEHPIIGDLKYGDVKTNSFYKKNYGVTNQLLHASELVFKEENGILEYLYDKRFTAAQPHVFDKFI